VRFRAPLQGINILLLLCWKIPVITVVFPNDLGTNAILEAYVN
jgi:hypothetical protein